MTPAIETREMSRDEWTAASGVASRAFFDEAFMVGMLGIDPLERFRGAHQLYAGETFDHAAVHLGAYVGDALVGVIRASAYGTCHVCLAIDPGDPPSDPVEAKEWLFEVGVRETHLRHGPHAWISRVAVEPQVHGAGVGSALLRAALAALSRQGGGLVLLECLASRESFYLAHGFDRRDDVPEPFADASYLMGLQVPAATS
jgi:GNAT superfamily N-acetyltransferase